MGWRGLLCPEGDASGGPGHRGFWGGVGGKGGSPGPGRRVWLGPGWAGLGLSWNFYVWLGFKERGETERKCSSHICSAL
jgi:hypothetical protein